MQQVAVFVDAGYIYAQGAAVLFGHPRPREHLGIRPDALKAALDAVRLAKCADRPLLRIYWYDAAPALTRLSTDQWTLAQQDDIKLRRGSLNAQGQQKGIDTLIVTDLIELARNEAMSDAVLVSGDGDLSVGVQIAQNYGVRVHLIGMAGDPGRDSVSPLLAQEADTRTSWTAETIELFLSARAEPESAGGESPFDVLSEIKFDIEDTARLELVAQRLAETLGAEDLAWLAEGLARNPSIPADFDRQLLTHGGGVIAREITFEEKRQLRASFRAAIVSRVEAGKGA